MAAGVASISPSFCFRTSASPSRSALVPSSSFRLSHRLTKESRLRFINDISFPPFMFSGSVRAMDISEPGFVQSTLIDSMTSKIKEQLNTNEVVIQDAYGDGRHVSIVVISAEFEGKTSVNRQRMVYKAIWEELQNAVHAVDSMRTLTPEEAVQENLKEST